MNNDLDQYRGIKMPFGRSKTKNPADDSSSDRFFNMEKDNRKILLDAYKNYLNNKSGFWQKPKPQIKHFIQNRYY